MADIDPADRPDRFARLNTRWVRIVGALAVVVAAAVVVPTLTSEPNRDETAIQTRDRDEAGAVDLGDDAVDAGLEIPADEDDDEDTTTSTTTATTIRSSTTAPAGGQAATTTTLAANPPATTATTAAPASCSTDAAAVASISASLDSTRANAGLQPLTRSSKLDGVAQDWACQMAKNGMAHNPNYVAQVFAACDGCTGVAENVVNHQSAAGAWRLWMDSDAHRNNILDARGGKHGVGAARNAQGQLFVVHNFGWN